jgi:integrase
MGVNDWYIYGCNLTADLEERVMGAQKPAQLRDALLDRAAFYLLWHGGLRLGEVEDLRLSDLNLSRQQLVVRQGKGMKDRTVYLTEVATNALVAYLDVRGQGHSDHLFLYRHRRLCRGLVHNRIKAAGKRTGVKVTCHRLRHTCATQLVNAGCRITTIQALLGHRRLNATMLYARVRDRTVAEDYYAAMAVIERRLEPHLGELPEQETH